MARGGAMTSETAVETDLPVLQQMIDSLTDYAVIRLDTDGLVQSWHPGAERLTGYQASEIVGHPVTILLPEEDARSGATAAELAAAARDGRFETEGWRVRKDGSRFWASVILAPI